jgi:hypothetical protein
MRHNKVLGCCQWVQVAPTTDVTPLCSEIESVSIVVCISHRQRKLRSSTVQLSRGRMQKSDGALLKGKTRNCQRLS